MAISQINISSIMWRSKRKERRKMLQDTPDNLKGQISFSIKKAKSSTPTTWNETLMGNYELLNEDFAVR